MYNANNRTFTPEKQNELNAFVQVLEEDQNSFEYNMAVVQNSNYSVESFSNLSLCYSLEPNNTEVLTQFVGHAEVHNDDELKKEFIEKLDENDSFNEAEKAYNKNVLMSIDESSYLFTNGDEDTYPAFMEQEINDQGKSVQVLSLELLQNPDYRNRMLGKMNLPDLPGIVTSDQIVSHVLNYKKNGEIYMALTLPHHLLIKHSQHLFLTGLALKYDESPDDDYLQKMDETWRKNMERAYVDEDEELNVNYLLMLKRLHQYYSDTGKNKEKKNTAELIQQLCNRFNIPNPIAN